MATTVAVRFIAGRPALFSLGLIHLQLRVKAGSSRDREGILAVTDKVIELCVTAPPRHGEANNAVVKVLSDATDIPKSRFHFVRGLKSKDKVVAISDVQGDGLEYTQTILQLLRKASHRSPPP